MYSRVNYAAVGLFVLLFGVGLIAFAFWLAKFDSQEAWDTYKMYFTESVTGLSKDATVKLRGVDVGRVAAIRIDPHNIEQVEVTVKIKQGVPIKEDMVAHVEMIGVTGLLSVLIDGGSNGAKTLQPKVGNPPTIQTKASWFYKAKEGMGELSERMSWLLKRSQKILTEQNIANFEKILANLSLATQKAVILESKAIVSLDEMTNAVNEIRDTMQRLDRRVSGAVGDFHTITEATLPALKRLQQTTNNFNRVARKVEKGLNRGDYDLKQIFQPLITDSTLLIDEINGLIRKIETNPSDFIFKSRKSRKGPGE